MRYQVHIVGDDDLPQGINKAIVELDDGRTVLFINGEPARTWRLMRGYEQRVEAAHLPSICVPVQRSLVAV